MRRSVTSHTLESTEAEEESSDVDTKSHKTGTMLAVEARIKTRTDDRRVVSLVKRASNRWPAAPETPTRPPTPRITTEPNSP